MATFASSRIPFLKSVTKKIWKIDSRRSAVKTAADAVVESLENRKLFAALSLTLSSWNFPDEPEFEDDFPDYTPHTIEEDSGHWYTSGVTGWDDSPKIDIALMSLPLYYNDGIAVDQTYSVSGLKNESLLYDGEYTAGPYPLGGSYTPAGSAAALGFYGGELSADISIGDVYYDPAYPPADNYLSHFGATTPTIYGWSVNLCNTCPNSTNLSDGSTNQQISSFGEDGPTISAGNGTVSGSSSAGSFGGFGGDVPYLQNMGTLDSYLSGYSLPSVDGVEVGSVIGIVKSATDAKVAIYGFDGKWVTSSVDTSSDNEGNDSPTTPSSSPSTDAAGELTHSGQEYKYIDADGTQYVFNDFTISNASLRGTLLSMTRPGGYGKSISYNSSGRISSMTVTKASPGGTVTDVYAYTYDTTNTQVVRHIVQSRGSTDIRTVDYDYYGTGSSNGAAWTLKTVTTRDGGLSGPVSGVEYFRWYVGTSSDGYDGALKMHLSDTGYARALAKYVTTTALESAPDTSSTGGVADFADQILTYDMAGSLLTTTGLPRVKTITSTSNGAGCSCGANGQGTVTYTYAANTAILSAGPNVWRNKTTATNSDGSKTILYTNNKGQTVLEVTQEAGGHKYLKWNHYDGKGRVDLRAEGNAITGFSESFADLVGYKDSGTYLTATGQIEQTIYFTATDNVDTALYGHVKSTGILQGPSDTTPDLITAYTYTDGALIGDSIYYVSTQTSYPTEGTITNPRVTSYTYTWWQDSYGHFTSQAKTILTKSAQVDSSQNGADSSRGSSSNAYKSLDTYDSAGRLIWHVDGNGYISYYEYDSATGAMTKQISDVDPASISSPPVSAPTRSSSLPSALNLITTIVVDDLGRKIKVTDPNGNITYTVYDDLTSDGTPRRTVTYAGWDATTKQPTGPVYATIEDPATGITDTVTYTWSASGGLPVHTSGDLVGYPTGEEDFSSGNMVVRSLVRTISNLSGQRVEVREYTDLPSSITYVPDTTNSDWINFGTVGTNYLSTKYKYDSGARLYQTTTPDGTITMTVHDARGLALSTWKGTNNTGSTETDPDGSGGSNNMVKVAEFTYDDDGNQLTSTAIADGSNSYTTTYQYDSRRRLTDVRGPDGVATKYTYNNLDEQLSADHYADTDSDFRMDVGEWFGREGSSYDDQGRVYRSTSYVGLGTALTLTSLTASGTTGNLTVTATKSGHGYAVGQLVTISGAAQSAYDGSFIISGVSSSTFTYQIHTDTAIATTASGMITSQGPGTAMSTDNWYDRNGNLIKNRTRTGLLNKYFYDGAGRLKGDAVSVDYLEVSWADSQTTSNDIVIEQNDYVLDKGGRTRLSTNWKYDNQTRVYNGDTASPNAGTYDHTSVAYWYDAADRLIASANYGRDGNENGATSADALVWNTAGYSYKDSDSDGIPNVVDAAQDADPGLDYSSSATGYRWIYTGYAYTPGGQLLSVIDNAGRETRYVYDIAGRLRLMIENYDAVKYANTAGRETETDTDRTTQYDYDAEGRLASQTAYNPRGSGNGVDAQVTSFGYTSNIDRSWVTATIYGDAVGTSISRNSSGAYTISGSDGQFATYDRQGRKTSETDQRGVKHIFGYDPEGRLETDSLDLATLPSSLDSRVSTIKYSYDGQSRITKVTSKDSAGSVVNEVAYGYDQYGNVDRESQAHSGAVDSATPTTRYLYSGFDGFGLTYVAYPSDTATYTYNLDAMADAINQVTGLPGAMSGVSDEVEWVGYSYLGLGNINRSSYVFAGGTSHTGGWQEVDHLINLDRYGRLKQSAWGGSDDGTSVGTTDFRAYRYDRMGNRIKTDVANYANFDETYTYDGLNRLSGYARGTISSGTISSPKFTQSWTLDTLGNWRSFSQSNNDTTLLPGVPSFTQSRAVNLANEITSTTGGSFAATTYDASGNLTTAPKTGSESTAIHCVFDGWNRLAGIDANGDGDLNDSGDLRYAYDGLGRQISKFTLTAASGTAGALEESYFNTDGQIVEVHKGSVSSGGTLAHLDEKIFWNAEYVNAPLRIEKDLDADGSPDVTYHPIWDANYNIIGVLDYLYGNVIERYAYTPYGQQTIINGDSDADGTAGTVDTNGSDVGNVLGFQGMRWDADAGEYLSQTRRYLPSLGTWNSRDPLGTAYQDGMNLYQCLTSNPVIHLDPTGKSITVYIWDTHDGNSRDPRTGRFSDAETGKFNHSFSIGHASMDAGSAHVSWWPSVPRSLSSPHVPAPNQKLADDEAKEDNYYYYKVPIDACQDGYSIDEKKIESWWANYASPSSKDWNAFYRECAQVVSRGLKAGGAKISEQYWPMDLLREVKKLKHGLIEMVAPPLDPGQTRF